MKKILFPLFVFCLVSTTLFSCNKKSDIDSDFDGLTDDIDPDPNNNQYKFVYDMKTVDESGKEIIKQSKDFTFSVDYRNFFKDPSIYNLDLLQLGAFAINEHNYKPDVPRIINNVYPKKDDKTSLVSRIYSQIGGKDITHVSIADIYKDSQYDKYDISDVFLAHHTINFDNKKHQVFFITIYSYPLRTGWFSNFDAGSQTNDYKELTGEHPEWNEKKNHKGYDITASRIKNEIEKYRKQHIDNDAEVVNYLVGQSRGGSVANLLGKKLIDNGQKTICYCLNPSNTTSETDQTVLDRYTSIHSIINKDDIVSMVPLKDWEYSLYGKKYYYQLSKHIEEFEYQFNQDFKFNTKEAINAILGLIKNKIPTIDDGYKFNSRFHKNITGFDDETKAIENIENDIETLFKSCVSKEEIKKCINYKIELDETDNKYYAYWKLRPIIICYAVLEVTNAMELGMSGLEIAINIIPGFLKFLLDDINEAKDILLKYLNDGSLSIDGFRFAHRLCSVSLGINLIE